MSSPQLTRIVINSLKAILGEDFTIHSFERLPSRRNEIYKIIGSLPSQPKPTPLVAKYFHQTGIAHETSILQEAHHNNLHVPAIIGTTADVLVLEYINAPNLCDLITIYPDRLLGQMLALWLARFHTVFSRGADQVLTKGDARIRNFLVSHDHLVGVDFEESQIGPYHEDLAVACASILDTTPLFTKPKLRLCSILLDYYAAIRQISNRDQLKVVTRSQMIQVLHETAIRRGNPPELLDQIRRFESGANSF
jgi:tRNA A-37 threonylcarbamoyl transferase component Bud32